MLLRLRFLDALNHDDEENRCNIRDSKNPKPPRKLVIRHVSPSRDRSLAPGERNSSRHARQLNQSARIVRAWASVAMVLAGALAVSACSGGGGEEAKKYTTPNALCGISLDPELLDSFLPGGDSISVKPSSPNGGAKQCDVIVDGDVSVRQIQTWWSNGESASTVAAAYDKMDDGQVTDDDRFLSSGTGSVGKTTASCKSSDHPDQTLYAVVQVFAPDRSDSGAMKTLITAYTKALEDSGACG
ncbi:hypothetical protein [Streptomyces sp. V4I2]|uniref:hypothetical protein n=1 Tax=Streptomyces sp. V4I2 TaxID=3042280 RepID=UPI0027D8E35D|nr:hypothetical protein [Streptomyces sp. V4I2]